MTKYLKLSPEIHKEIADKYKNEKVTETILSKEYDVSETTISNILKKFRVPTEKRRGFYHVNTNYLKEIDTPNKAYFLGLFHADGTNSEINGCIRISLQEEDKKVLEKLRVDMEYEGNLRYIKREGNRKNQFSLSIVSKELSIDLNKLGYPSNKTFKVTYPEYLCPNLIKHFIRGIFDGDGCIFISKNNKMNFNIVGTYHTLKGISNYFLQYLNINCFITESSTKDIFTLSVHKKYDIFKLYEHLYENAKIYITRKYLKFYEAFEIRKDHLYWQIYCKDLKTEIEYKFKNLQEAKDFFGLKHYGSISYCINKSKNKIFRNRYYLNLLQNE